MRERMLCTSPFFSFFSDLLFFTHCNWLLLVVCCARLGYASNYLTTPTESRRFVVPSGTKSWYVWSAASQVTTTWHCQCEKKTSHQSSCYLLDLANARMKSYPRYCSCSQVPTYFWGKIFLILVLSCLAPSLPQPPGVFHESLHSSCGHYHWK